MKYDMKKLKMDLVNAAGECRKAKSDFKESIRAYIAGDMQKWSKLNVTRSQVLQLADRMTLLCSIKAHLRGKLHRQRIKKLIDGKWARLELTFDDQETFITSSLNQYVAVVS